MKTYRELLDAQLREWPNSMRLQPYMLLHWAHSAPDADQRYQRMVAIAGTTQHPRVLFYITDPKGGYIGARYGLEPDQYISGFGFYKATFNGAYLRDTGEM
jgi:hypothetical protein